MPPLPPWFAVISLLQQRPTTLENAHMVGGDFNCYGNKPDITICPS
jgi:hypothetical protein